MDFDEERDQLLSAITAKDEQLRELLSRCRHGEEFEDWPASSVYGDIANKLAAILDGEQ